MNISEPFIVRPIATSLLMLGILGFGITGYNLLPVAALPAVDFPTISVTAQLPGASPETMASSVATPLEQQFAAHLRCRVCQCRARDGDDRDDLRRQLLGARAAYSKAEDSKAEAEVMVGVPYR